MLGDLWDWLVGVVRRIGGVPVGLLLLALALKTAESAFIGLGWRNIFRAAYPKSKLSFKTAGSTVLSDETPANDPFGPALRPAAPRRHEVSFAEVSNRLRPGRAPLEGVHTGTWTVFLVMSGCI